MTKSIQDILYVLKYFKKENISFLLILMLFVSFLELIGISLILPFITSLLDNNLANKTYLNLIGIEFIDTNRLTIYLILIVLIFYFLKNFLLFLLLLNKQDIQ